MLRLALITLANAVQLASSIDLLVGSGSDPTAVVYEFDELTGALAETHRYTAATTGRGTGWWVLELERAYAINSGSPTGAAAAFNRLPLVGSLAPLGETRSSGGAGPCHASLAATTLPVRSGLLPH